MQDMSTGRVHYPAGIKVPAGARDLIKKILQPDPKKRMTLGQIQEHKWFQPGYATPKRMGIISPQTEADITRIVRAARVQPVGTKQDYINEDEIEE